MATPIPPPPTPPGQRGPLRGPLAALAVVVLAIVAVAIGTNAHRTAVEHDGSTAQIAEALAPTMHTVIYNVALDGEDGVTTSADITYMTPSGISQQEGVDVPLTSESGVPGITLTKVPDGQFLSISAQLAGNDGPHGITCTISVDGAVVATNTSSGEYAIADCNTTAA